ncbi:TNF receptor-associated factor 6 [Hydra vulgaris]|uniref:TNF receptor-associated factor 6 n=1 Tax=Hydra vulgaris TaxID=6087 RepID=UPI001F5E5BA9|nr:TNF receptor-associated factor 6 [Hydra vulgaris]
MDLPRVLIERNFDLSDYEVSDEISDSDSNNSCPILDNELPSEKNCEGYDVEVDGIILTELECPLCSLVLRNPVQLEQCGHCMCRNCLNKWKIHSRSHSAFRCPICRVDIKEERIFENKMVNRMVLNLRVFCSNKKKKCNWLGELRDLKRHKERDCEYEEISCIYEGCMKRFLRCYMGLHEERCAYRVTPCDYCEERVRVRDAKNHLRTCERVPIDCVEHCDAKIVRCEMDNHLANECPLHTIQCSFHSIGCDFLGERKLMKNHMEENVCKHLELSLQSGEQMRRTLRTQASIISDLKENMRLIQRDMSSYRKRIRSLEVGAFPRRRSVSQSSDASLDQS